MFKIERLNIFDFLRGFAALGIVIAHSFKIYYRNHPGVSIHNILNLPAATCVWIFFIISGYLIGKGFFSGKYKTDNIKDFLNFYIQRCVRILPIYFLIVTIDLFFVNTSIYFNFDNQILKRAFTLTLRQDYLTAMIGSMWFICTLMQLYFIAPFVNKFFITPIRHHSNAKLIAGILFFILLGSELIMRIVTGPYTPWLQVIYENVRYNLDLFFCGFLFNFYTLNNEDNMLKKYMRPSIFLLFLVFFFVNSELFNNSINIGNLQIRWILIIPSIIILILLAMIYSFDIKKTNNIGLSNYSIWHPLRWFEILGGISMGMFLCHSQTICNLVKIIHFKEPSIFYFNLFNLLQKPLKITFSAHAKELYLITLLAIISAIIWGIIIHIMVEKPLNKFRYNLIDRKNK